MTELVTKSGKIAFVDDEDYPVVSRYSWYVSKDGYVYTIFHVGKISVSLGLHQFVLGRQSKSAVDHENLNKLDNQKHNLRLATNSQNHANTPKTSRQTSSRYKGVNWDRGKWVARIRVNGHLTNLGRFSNEHDAASSYNAAAVETWGKFARINVL